MTGRRPLHRSAAGAIVAVLAIVVLAADQFVKQLTVQNMSEGERIPVLGEFFELLYVRNPGAAFSLGKDHTWIFTIALAVVAGVVIWKAFGLQSRLWAVVLGCLLGGVLGNLTDRLFRAPGFPVGEVVDMLSLPWMMPAIFNVADIFIVSGMISVALLVLIGLRFDGTRDRDHERAAAEAAEGTEVPASDGASKPATPES
ncbi:signal peptidase II [Microbacterium sp. 2216-1]|uniref:signal peptidase II n=1 Tax=Microbacterium TaxID=33882 RepID=UPI0015C6D307|nr:signal peptidase II [Microbacterium esteraromaticum]MBN7792168.1 signal peptidase II [Microbacterium esteraromaticum]MBN8422994.1 signal peptidase II [Microbacterium esteraromaticum]MCA1308048.1 signal peptidase II [Microbacterium esteraromaticum]